MSVSANGVDLAALRAWRAQVEADPPAARRTVRASAVWRGGFESEVRMRDHAPLISDEPARAGGGNAGPTPGELLLGALGACLVVGFALNAALRGITIRALSVSVEGESDPASFVGLDVSNDSGYHRVRALVDLDADATPEELADLHAQVMRSSPVGSTLSGHVELESTLVGS
jgi:uncharacterized OsmC-like protein